MAGRARQPWNMLARLAQRTLRRLGVRFGGLWEALENGFVSGSLIAGEEPQANHLISLSLEILTYQVESEMVIG